MHILGIGEVGEIVGLVKQFGPLLVAVMFFLYRDYKREDRLMQRIVHLEDEQRNVVLPLVTKCTDVIARNTEVMDSVKHKLKG